MKKNRKSTIIGWYEKEPLEFFMIIYDPQDHRMLWRNTHEPGFTPEL